MSMRVRFLKVFNALQSANVRRPLVKGGGACYNGNMKLVLCCDYGIDDAAATVDALSHALADGYASAALVAVGGNVPADVALTNAKKLAAHLDFGTVPYVVVDTTAEEQPAQFLKDIHGGDGMGDVFADDHGFSAPVLRFSEWLDACEGEYDLLSLGPMTLIPRILARLKIRKFVLMGGNIAETPNFHGYEFNHALNRAAFSRAVAAMPHVAVTMDTCRHPLLNVQDVDLGGEGLQRLFVRRAREMTFVSGEKGCYIWDDMAVKALRHPDWFDCSLQTDRDGNVLNVARYILGKPYTDILDR